MTKPPSKTKITKMIASASEQTVTDPSDINEDLKLRLDSVEYLLENLGQTQELFEEISAYVKESKAELRHLKYYRIAAISAAGLIIAFLLSLLVCVVFYHQIWFFIQGPITRSSVIVGTIAGSIVLATVVLKGVFRSAEDKSKETALPEQFKLLVEATKAFKP